MFKRRIKLLAKTLLAVIALFCAFLLVERFRGQIALASYKKELIAKGEKLSPQDFVAPVLDADNGAPSAIAAIERLKSGTVLPITPPRMKLLSSGRAIVGFHENEWVETSVYRDGDWVNETVTNHWEQLAADLKTNESILAEIRIALAKPVLNNHVNLAEGMKMKFLHLSPVKTLTFWLGSSSQLALHEGHNREALSHLLVQIRLPHLLAEDHIAISELVRIAMAGIARTDTWEALQSDGWSDEEVAAAIQTGWTKLTFGSNMVDALEGERIFISGSIQEMRNSNNETYNALFGPFANFWDNDESETNGWMGRIESLPYGKDAIEIWRKQIYCRLWRFAWSHQAERRTMQNMTELIGLARSAARDASYQSIESNLTMLLVRVMDKGIYDRMRFPPPESIASLSKTIEKAVRSETDRSLTIAAIALKRYHLRHGEYPNNLAALTPEFLSAVPVDYMDGKPIRYHLNEAGGFTLYSVGEDGKDDGGDTTSSKGSGSSNPWTRRDYVWPAPATPEEVEEYRRQAGKN